MDLKKDLLQFYKYWFTSFKNPADWFSPQAKSRDNHLKRKYSLLHNLISSMKWREIKQFIEITNHNTKIYISIIILLDQVSRQLYRDSCRAFQQDKIAIKVCDLFYKTYNVLDITPLNVNEFEFWAMPYEHSESLSHHQFIREIIKKRIQNETYLTNKNKLNLFMKYLDKHTQVLLKFGYYPKRKIQCKKRLNKEDLDYISNENKGFNF